jgi:AcrR family transcriptional regulator
MTVPVKRVRKYNSARRQEQAGQNRARVLGSARQRFLSDGYAATSIPTIAADAGVSVETVYKAFGNKAGLLKALFDIAVVGDQEPVPLMEREVVKQNMAEPDPRQKLRMYADFYAETAARANPYQLLARNAAASDPAAAAVWAQMVQERLVGMNHLARHLSDGGHLRPDVTADDAQDILWTFNSVEMWELLVLQRRWQARKFADWMGDMLISALL